MKLHEALRFLFDKQYRLWHIARIAQHSQWTPTLATKPITALDVESNIDLCPTQQIKALPKTQRDAVQAARVFPDKKKTFETEPMQMLSATEHFKAVQRERKANESMLYRHSH